VILLQMQFLLGAVIMIGLSGHQKPSNASGWDTRYVTIVNCGSG